MDASITAILLAGGTGSRMGLGTPKQYLAIHGIPIAMYSFQVFASMPEITEIVVVCAEEYRYLFPPITKKLIFADPGARRQDSVYNGLICSDPSTQFLCIHDAARPILTSDIVYKAIEAAYEYGASVVGTPVKNTIKQADKEQCVSATPDRASLWDIHTPQVIRRDLLCKGFDNADQYQLTVTDDASLIESFHRTIKIVQGDPRNIKITTPEDLAIAEFFLGERHCGAEV